MDESEQKAQIFLESLGYSNISPEPDGNIPPDLLVDKTIAVEVRRLNQNIIGETGYQGLEQVEIPLWMKMRKLLASFGPSSTGVSWFVSYRFRRPLVPPNNPVCIEP